MTNTATLLAIISTSSYHSIRRWPARVGGPPFLRPREVLAGSPRGLSSSGLPRDVDRLCQDSSDQREEHVPYPVIQLHHLLPSDAYNYSIMPIMCEQYCYIICDKNTPSTCIDGVGFTLLTIPVLACLEPARSPLFGSFLIYRPSKLQR